jgi:cell division transport system permease protein
MRNALTGVERALFWTLAFAAFAAAAAGLAARAVDRVAADYEAQRSNYAIVRVIAPEGAAGIAAAEVALAQAPLVSSAAPMTAGRAAALLSQWGGGEVAPADMPPLRLIEVELASASSPGVDVGGDIVAALAQGGVTAEVIEAPNDASGGGLAARVRAAAFWGAVAFAAMMAVIISLAARSLAARRREMVTVMCDLGATRSQAAGRVADEAAALGLYAGLVGGVLAGAAAIIVLWLAIPGLSLDALPGMILPVDFAPIVAAPLGAAIAAGFGARAAAGYFHGQAARLG